MSDPRVVLVVAKVAQPVVLTNVVANLNLLGPDFGEFDPPMKHTHDVG
jgi:hypothetical protein